MPKFCPPFCGKLLILPEPTTVLGTNELVLALVGLTLLLVALAWPYLKLLRRPALRDR